MTSTTPTRARFYIVTAKESTWTTYQILADSPDDAREKILRGHGKELSRTGILVEREEMTIEEDDS